MDIRNLQPFSNEACKVTSIDARGAALGDFCCNTLLVFTTLSNNIQLLATDCIRLLGNKVLSVASVVRRAAHTLALYGQKASWANTFFTMRHHIYNIRGVSLHSRNDAKKFFRVNCCSCCCKGLPSPNIMRVGMII